MDAPAVDGLAALTAQFERDVAERAAKELALTEERKTTAERDLDTFYDELTDKKAHQQASNREREEEDRARASAAAAGPANPFERVVELIGGAAADAAEGTRDLEVMRSLLVRLKNDPVHIVERAPAPAAPQPPAAPVSEIAFAATEPAFGQASFAEPAPEAPPAAPAEDPFANM